jgi:sulfite exporter TauE/SafE
LLDKGQVAENLLERVFVIYSTVLSLSASHCMCMCSENYGPFKYETLKMEALNVMMNPQ